MSINSISRRDGRFSGESGYARRHSRGSPERLRTEKWLRDLFCVVKHITNHNRSIRLPYWLFLFEWTGALVIVCVEWMLSWETIIVGVDLVSLVQAGIVASTLAKRRHKDSDLLSQIGCSMKWAKDSTKHYVIVVLVALWDPFN